MNNSFYYETNSALFLNDRPKSKQVNPKSAKSKRRCHARKVLEERRRQIEDADRCGCELKDLGGWNINEFAEYEQ